MVKQLLKTCVAVLAIAALSTGPARGQDPQPDPTPVEAFAQDGDTYTINSKAGWDTLCARVLRAETFNGKTILLAVDLKGADKVTTMAGRAFDASSPQDRHFQGTFDGQGHTLEVYYVKNGISERVAPFPKADEFTTIKNLHLTGVVYNSVTGRANGLVGVCAAGTKIENCHVSCAVTGGVMASGVSQSGGTITNTIFDGTLEMGGAYNGGFAAFPRNGSSITNCVFMPKSVNTDGGTYRGTFHSYNDSTVTITNSYFFTSFSQATRPVQGKRARTLGGRWGVTVGNAGDTVQVDVNTLTGFKAFTTGGIIMNDTLYGGLNDSLILTLGGSTTGYVPTAGILSGSQNPYGLLMADINTLIGMDFTAYYTLRDVRPGWQVRTDTNSNENNRTFDSIIPVTDGVTDPIAVGLPIRFCPSAADGYKVKFIRLGNTTTVLDSMATMPTPVILVCGDGDTLTGNINTDIIIVIPNGAKVVMKNVHDTNSSPNHPAVYLQGNGTIDFIGTNSIVNSSDTAEGGHATIVADGNMTVNNGTSQTTIKCNAIGMPAINFGEVDNAGLGDTLTVNGGGKLNLNGGGNDAKGVNLHGAVAENNSTEGTFVVQGYQPVITGIAAYDTLVYNRLNQNLVTAGTTTGGILKYTLTPNVASSWSETVPADDSAMTYTIYYKAFQQGLYSASDVYNLTSTIAPKPVSPKINLSAIEFTYNRGAQKPTVTSVVDTTDANATIAASEYTVRYGENNTTENSTDSGVYQVILLDNLNGNYTVTSDTVYTIVPKTVSNPTIVLPTSSEFNYTYSGTAKAPTVVVKDGGDTIPASEYTVSYSNNTNAGTATVTITDKATPNGNYVVNGSKNFIISKAAVTVTNPSNKSGQTYNGSALPLCVAGSVTTGGTMEYSLDNSNWSTSVPTAVTANYGNARTVYWRVTVDENHTGATSGTVTGTINQHAGWVDLSTSSVPDGLWSFPGISQNKTFSVTSHHGGSLDAAAGSTDCITASASGTTVTVSKSTSCSDGSFSVTVTCAQTENYTAASKTIWYN